MTTTAHALAEHWTTASLAGVPSHQHQRCTQTKRGNARGVTSAHILVADYQPQDRSAIGRAGLLSMTPKTSLLTGAGFGRRTFSHSHRVAVPSLTQSRKRATGFLPLVVRAYSRCAGSNRARDLSANLTGSNRLRVRQSLAHEHVFHCLAHVPHLSSLSSAVAFAGSQTSEALNGRVPNSSGAFQKSEGELPNVCC